MIYPAMERTSTAHSLILTASDLMYFQYILMYLGNCDAGIHDQLSLKGRHLVTAMQKRVEHTLKTRRTLSRPDLQPIIISLWFFEPKNRDTVSLAMFSNLILYVRDGPEIENVLSRKVRHVNIAGTAHPINWFIASVRTCWGLPVSSYPFPARGHHRYQHSIVQDRRNPVH